MDSSSTSRAVSSCLFVSCTTYLLRNSHAKCRCLQTNHAVMKNTDIAQKRQARSLVQGIELKIRVPGVLPWYSLDAFEMDGLPCALTVPTTSSAQHCLPGLLPIAIHVTFWGFQSLRGLNLLGLKLSCCQDQMLISLVAVQNYA
eukprot:COSAG02_NODE_137_length_34526_cov_94.448079_14_plen_144_part_00